MNPPSTFLFAMWDGGGTGPPEFGLVRRLVAAGHRVHVLADPTLEVQAREAGASFSPWVRAPHRRAARIDDDLVRDWEADNPLAMLRALRDRLLVGPADRFAADTAEAIRQVDPDAVLVDSMLLGAMVAAQGAGLPLGVVMPNIWTVPTPGVPAFGPGFAPAHGIVGRTRDRVVNRLVDRVFARALPAFNAVRAAHGLRPIGWLWEQLLVADRIAVLTSPTFDVGAQFAPDHATFVGPILDEPAWAAPWDPPWDGDDRPLVLVGYSSTYQAQEDLLRRTVDALAAQDLRAVVTLGPMIDPATCPSPSPDVVVVQSAPHSQILPHASAVVTHAGHGTTMRALAASTPLVCIPMGRDQNDTAARVVHAGAGVRLGPKASAAKIGDAIDTVLADAAIAASAKRLGAAIEREVVAADVVGVCEALVRPGHAGRRSMPI